MPLPTNARLALHQQVYASFARRSRVAVTGNVAHVSRGCVASSVFAARPSRVRGAGASSGRRPRAPQLREMSFALVCFTSREAFLERFSQTKCDDSPFTVLS